MYNLMKKSNKKSPLWFPYTSKIVIKKTQITFIYKGGEYNTDAKNIHSIMFYGAICALDETFLQLCNQYRVPICIHRRNMAQAIWITPSISTSNKDDILTKQILYKIHKTESSHIVRKLLHAKFKSMALVQVYVQQLF